MSMFAIRHRRTPWRMLRARVLIVPKMVQTFTFQVEKLQFDRPAMPVASRAMKQYTRGRHTVYHHRYHTSCGLQNIGTMC